MHDVNTTLKYARAIQAERGHSKGLLEDADGHVCLRGALNLAMTGQAGQCGEGEWATYGHPNNDLMRACELAMGFELLPMDRCCHLTDAALWNNMPDTTEEMVLERFDRGIAATAPERELATA